jgi:hypothetical protein
MMHTNTSIEVPVEARNTQARLFDVPTKCAKILTIAFFLLFGTALLTTQTVFAQAKPKKGASAAAPAPEPAPTATAGDPVLTNRATEMYKAADSDSPVVEKLPAKTQVRVVERKGKWHRVIAASNATGWVNMMHLRGEVVVLASNSEPGILSGITGAFSASSSSGSQKSQGATLGIRGLTAEQLQNAAPNPAALAKVRSFKSDSGDAERFAREASLKKVEASLIDSNGKPTTLKL